MPFIIAVAQIADHHARYGRMYKLIVAEINAYMRDAPVLPTRERMEKNEITFLQLIARDMPAGLVLLFRCPWQRASNKKAKALQSIPSRLLPP